MNDGDSRLSQEAEVRVIGQILDDPRIISEIIGLLLPSDFTDRDYAAIFDAMLRIEAKNRTITSLAVLEEMGKDHGPINGIDLELVQTYGATSPRTVKQYAAMIRRQRQRRELLHLGHAMTSAAMDVECDLAQTIDRAIDEMLKITHDPDAGNMVDMYDQMAPALEAAEDASRGGSESSGLKTGLRDLDAIIGGLRPGNLVLIAARPGVGKSALAMNIATHVAESTTKVVLVFNLEMSARELAYRIIADRGDIDAQRLMRGRLSADEWARTIGACSSASELTKRMRVLDQSYLTPAILRAHLKREMRKHDVGVVVVDYIQLMSSGLKRENQNVEVSQISRGLKVLARDFAVPIIALSQLNRAVEGRSEGVPRLSDLRDSGSLEQDADAVLFIHREDHASEANIIVAKQRNGPKGRIVLSWDAKSIRFRNARDVNPPEADGGLYR